MYNLICADELLDSVTQYAEAMYTAIHYANLRGEAVEIYYGDRKLKTINPEHNIVAV